MTRKPAVAALYLASFYQGLTLVSFPAAAPVLKGVFTLSDAQYGTIFLPQLALVVVGALAGGALARRWGLGRLLTASMAANTLSQAALFATSLVPLTDAYAILSVGTAFLGLAFGLSAAPLNALPGLLFPDRQDLALVAGHATVGLGLALGPVPSGWLGTGPSWQLYPLGLALLGAVLVVVAAVSPLPHPSLRASFARSESGTASGPALWSIPHFWIFGVIAALYGFQEGIFQNWGILMLREEKGAAAETAALALTTFWMMATAGRIVATFLLLRVRAFALWRLLPMVIALSFLTIPLVRTPVSGIVLFALAGLGCSAFFPLTMALGTRAYPGQEARAASLLIVMLVTGNSGGTFLYGALRTHYSLSTLYQISAVLPVIVLGLMRQANPALGRKP